MVALALVIGTLIFAARVGAPLPWAGLLGLLCRGEQRFRVKTRSRCDDGLNRASVEWLEEKSAMPVAEQFQPLVPLLRQFRSPLIGITVSLAIVLG